MWCTRCVQTWVHFNQMLGTIHVVSVPWVGTTYLVPSTWYPVISAMYFVPSIWYFQCLVPSTRYQAPSTRYLVLVCGRCNDHLNLILSTRILQKLFEDPTKMNIKSATREQRNSPTRYNMYSMHPVPGTSYETCQTLADTMSFVVRFWQMLSFIWKGCRYKTSILSVAVND